MVRSDEKVARRINATPDVSTRPPCILFCVFAVEHSWDVSLRLTEVQLPVTARLARVCCRVEQVLHEVLLRYKLS